MMCATEATSATTHRRRRHSVVLAIVLFAVWLIWSGHFQPMLISIGAGSCLFVIWISRRMRIVDGESAPVHLGLRPFFLHMPWLVKEIVVANFNVARRILNPKMPISPRIFRVRASQRQDLGRVVYANSITLTPGTVSVDMAGNEITVHALSRESANVDKSGEMDRRVTKMEAMQ